MRLSKSMIHLIQHPKWIQAGGSPSKTIEEYVGKINTRTVSLSVARMRSPAGWSEPGQTPEFDEYTLVLRGELRVETRDGEWKVAEGQACFAPRGEWVRYSTPGAEGADYIAVCLPAFSSETAHRDAE